MGYDKLYNNKPNNNNKSNNNINNNININNDIHKKYLSFRRILIQQIYK